jgi:4-amino-4-deoxy-L-arabinose transferase-like glycosyltransferase
MPLRAPVATAWPSWVCRLLAAVLILGAAALHLAFLAWNCPLDLAPDEAHYWDWSRHLDWSYYSKGPLVAWFIRASCELIGPWSEAHTGNLAFAIRLPAVLCGSLLLWSVYQLSVQVHGREQLALGTVLVALTLPVISVGSTIMTIDSPYTCCWGWALVFGHRAIFRRSFISWIIAGLFVGVGILAKYTMVVWLPSIALFLLFTPEYRRELLLPGFWCMVGMAVLCCVPIAIWNAQHNWVTVRHVFVLAGITHNPPTTQTAAPASFTWTGPFTLLGEQCALFLGFWFLVWLCAMVARNPLRERDPGLRYLWWLSAPMFGVFFAFSVKTGGGEINWPVTTYISGLILGAVWFVDRFQTGGVWTRRTALTGLTMACAVGIFLTVVMHRSDVLYPVLDRIVGAPTNERQFPIRSIDPTSRLRGWRALGDELDRCRAELRARGIEPVLAGTGWNVPGELGVYCAGHPQAYSLGLAMGDRHSQYDLWENPLDNTSKFKHRTFVVVGGLSPAVEEAFDSVEARSYRHFDHGRPITEFPYHICRGYRGARKLDKGGNF